jgi:HK97 family phage portal protein
MRLNPLRWFQKKDYDLSDPMLSAIFGHGSTLSGVGVGPDSALRVPAVNAAVRVISESVAALPLHLFKRSGETKSRDTDNPIYGLIHDRPNGWSSSFDLRQQLQTDVLLHGHGFAFVNKVGGEAKEILRLAPGTTSVKIDSASGAPSYEVTETGGGKRTIHYTDVIHIRALNGIAPIVHAREAIALALGLEGHAARIMGNGGRPSGILKFKGAKLLQPQLDRIRSQWRDSHTGGAAGGTAVFDSDTDFQPLTFSSVDMQFLELRKHQIEEISRAFRVPPHLLSELGRATWGNASEMGQNFLDFCLLPWLLQWQGALTRALLTPEQQKTSFVEFDTNALTRANLAVRTESYAKAVGGPWMLANEARALENRPPIDGGDVLNEPPGTPLAANDNNIAKDAVAA